MCSAQPGRLQLASLRLSICYRWGGTQWGFGSSACLVSAARVRVSVPRWNLNGRYSWALQIHTHTLPCTKYDRWSTHTNTHTQAEWRKTRGKSWMRNHWWTAQMNYCFYLYYILHLLSWLSTFYWKSHSFSTLFTSPAWVGVCVCVVGVILFYFFRRVN